MIPPSIDRHPIARAIAFALIVGGVAVGVIRFFTPGPEAHRWYD